MGILARLWALVRMKELVGKDKAGNVYYRHSSMVDGAMRERRWVEYKGEPNSRTLPVEWLSWLTGQRKTAPSPEEITALEAHRKRVKMNAAMGEKEEEKRRFRAKSLQQDPDVGSTKPQEMSKFIEQVAALEGVNYDAGEKALLNKTMKGCSSMEETSRTAEPPRKGDSGHDVAEALKQKEKEVYEKWVPPS